MFSRAGIYNPLMPELNPSAQCRLQDFLLGILNFDAYLYIYIYIKKTTTHTQTTTTHRLFCQI